MAGQAKQIHVLFNNNFADYAVRSVDSVYYDRGDSGKYDRIGVWGVE
jgi:hypothetical protein